MEMFHRVFLRRPPSPTGAKAPLLQAPDSVSELDAARGRADKAASELQKALAENDEFQQLLVRRHAEEATSEERLAELQREVQASEEAAESAEHNRQEHVTTLRRRSVEATEEVSELRRSSAVRDSELAELRLQVEEGAAFRDEWRECEATTERVRIETNCARRALVEAETWHEEAMAAAERTNSNRQRSEAEVWVLTQELAEAQEEAQRRYDSYWEDAPFLMASADVVCGYEAEIAQSHEIAAEIEEALQHEQHLHEEALRDAREALALGDDMVPPTDGHMTPHSGDEGGAMEEPLASPAQFPSPQSLLLERTLPSPRPLSPVQTALAGLDSENERLRQKVKDLREQVEVATPLAGVTTPHLGHNSFDAAVAGTGARVVDQMKQALHDDVALLRNLHQVKQELDRERRRERRTRAALERQLAVLARGFRSPPPAAALGRPISVVHQPVSVMHQL